MSGVASAIGKVAGIVATVAIIAGNPAVAGIAAAVSPPAATSSPLTASRPMTAINLFADETAAYLATDGAMFGVDGTIVQLGGKIAAFPGLRLAIATSGKGGPLELASALDENVSVPTQAAFLDALPKVLRSLRDRYRRDFPDDEATNDVRLWVAAHDGSRPRLYVIATDALPFLPGSEPYHLIEVAGNAVPAIDVADVLPEGWIQHPKDDVLRILDAQRRYAFPHLDGNCGVGGACHLVTITADELTADEIIRFPEREGERADPMRPGEII